MTKKYTTEFINERYKERGIQLVNEYEGATVRALFRCSNGHEWMSTTRTVNRTKHCHECFIQSKIPSFDEVNERLKDTNIKLVSDYTKVGNKATFQCDKNHIWSAQVTSILNQKTRCPQCSSTYRLTTDVVNERIKDRGLKLVEEYKTVFTKSLFECANGHQWKSTVDNVMRVSSCPQCSTWGFNKEKSAYLYILEFETFLKYGITNVLESRLKRHKKNGKYRIVTTKFFAHGADALNLENKIKSDIGGSFVTKKVCVDGYTETLSLDKVDELMRLLEVA